MPLRRKDWLKSRAPRLWPWLALPVRTVRRIRARLVSVLRLLDPRRVGATWRWMRAFSEQLAGQPGRLAVAVDVNSYWEELTGVGWYLHQLLVHLADDDSVQLDLYGPTLFSHPDDQAPTVALPSGRALRWMRIAVPDSLLLPRDWIVRLMRRAESRIVARQRYDVLFAPNFLPPARFDRCRGALVITVHDLAARRFPWTLEEQTLSALERGLEHNVSRATAILTPSQAVRDELVAEGLARAERITVVHHGTGHVIGRGTVEGDWSRGGPAGRRSRARGEIPERYVLFVGTLEPRKNLSTLLAAWPSLRARRADRVVLVACGRWGWKSEELRAQVARARREGWLLHFGYVSDEELAELYRGALALACPSLYEGFGLPLVEAMAVGCPVVCSDLPVFREVAGSAALYVSPRDAEAWTRGLARLLDDPSLRDEMRRRGADRGRRFSWERAARETLAVWRRAAGEGDT